MLRASLYLLLAGLPAVPVRAGVALRPSLAPGLPGAAVPILSLAPKGPSLAAPQPLTPTLRVTLPLPSVSVAPRAAASAAQAPAAAPTPLAVLETITTSLAAAEKRHPAASAKVAAAAFDGSFARPAAPSWTPLWRANGVSAARDDERFPGELMGEQGAVPTPGSIFGWKPWAEARGHGFLPVDALVRWFFTRPAPGLSAGFEFRGAARRADARVFLYGEKHTDKALIAANMLALARDLDPVRGGIVLVEGYLGRTLRGSEAARFLAHRGLATEWLEGRDISRLEVRGWDSPASHDASTSLSLRHHMELLNLNTLVHGDGRGFAYYAGLARQARRVAQAYFAMRAAVIKARNSDLDRAVAETAADDDGRSIHVVAGSEHLLEHPLLARLPLVGRPGFRKSLAAAIGARPWWAAKPPDSRNQIR